MVRPIPPMRILALNWRDLAHPWAGGAEVYIHELAKRWVAWGHEVTLVCGGYPGCKAEEIVDGVRILRRGGRFTVYGRAFLEYVLRLARKCDAILDVENGVPFFTPLYARKPTVIVVHHVHQEVLFVEAGFPLNWITYLLEAHVMPRAYRGSVFVTGTPSTREGLIALGIPPSRIRVVPYGLDHALYHPSLEKAPAPTLLYVGRLRRYKRLDLLLRAMTNILRSCQDARLWIVGAGDARVGLEGLVSQLGLSRQVTFFGFVPEQEKVRLLQQAWVVVYPSMKEGWGLSILEANACGTPAIVFDVPGLRDAVVHEQTGFVIPDGDVGGLSHKVGLILRDASRREELRQSAIAWSGRFTWDDSAGSILKLLQEAWCHSR